MNGKLERRGTPETSSSASATSQSTVGISKAVVSVSFLSWMNFNFALLLLIIHKGPLLNSQLAICSQSSGGKQGSTAMVETAMKKRQQCQLLFAKCTKCTHTEGW